jgi:hypothetical protein
MQGTDMRISTVAMATILITAAQTAVAGNLIPMPGAGVAGPVALVAAVGAIAGLRYLRNRRGK